MIASAAICAALTTNNGMGSFETIEELCAMLKNACTIIQKQAAILNQHGIETEGGKLEQERAELLQKAGRMG